MFYFIYVRIASSFGQKENLRISNFKPLATEILSFTLRNSESISSVNLFHFEKNISTIPYLFIYF